MNFYTTLIQFQDIQSFVMTVILNCFTVFTAFYSSPVTGHGADQPLAASVCINDNFVLGTQTLQCLQAFAKVLNLPQDIWIVSPGVNTLQDGFGDYPKCTLRQVWSLTLYELSQLYNSAT